MINAISIKGSLPSRTFFSTRRTEGARERVREDRFVGMQFENAEYLAPRSLNCRSRPIDARRRRRRTNLSHRINRMFQIPERRRGIARAITKDAISSDARHRTINPPETPAVKCDAFFSVRELSISWRKIFQGGSLSERNM